MCVRLCAGKTMPRLVEVVDRDCPLSFLVPIWVCHSLLQSELSEQPVRGTLGPCAQMKCFSGQKRNNATRSSSSHVASLFRSIRLSSRPFCTEQLADAEGCEGNMWSSSELKRIYLLFSMLFRGPLARILLPPSLLSTCVPHGRKKGWSKEMERGGES